MLTITIIVLIAYLIFMLWIGNYAASKSTGKTESDYFVTGWTTGYIGISFSIAATFASGAYVLGTIGVFYGNPAKHHLHPPLKKLDRVYIFSGVMEDDLSTGAPVGLVIPNVDIEDIHIQQYRDYKDVIRPGHAEYTFFKKYGEYADWVGAGRASGRETAGRVAGGAVAQAVLDTMGIDVIGFVSESHGIKAGPITYEMAKANYRKNELNCPDLKMAQIMIDDILKIKEEGDTCGGVVEVIAKGVPSGLGEPVFDKLTATIAHGIMSIGAIKGLEFGSGFTHAAMKGSESNDPPYYHEESGRGRV
jgi:chorismate synthase